ncbi:phosphoribosylaminoimidazolesuccinocarboxamide synthase [Maribacter sp. SA7]|uniref:phosphoribosylaminoimidazolesuccinocarboxamide synthase n=1 Tax=Maribacter zhoushanensis TaxID=3030012 RepID=UPI0023ED672D|nr:phosphoribosylaminoimidazolesuccinocarboxamide synthase [Maribacter zhoushanensis]MDF4202231.1 phosphoribosylaminoimidazolesuccinocarboxamide synthase [Maribacter zhoushanensis]
MNDSEKRFKTKTGFCHILPEEIILTRDGIIGNISKITVGSSIWRAVLIYGGLSIFLLYNAFDGFQRGQTLTSVFFALFGLFLIYGIVKSLNNSATPIIKKDRIKNVKFKKAIFGFTRARFEVLFEDDNQIIKKRLIMLPGSLNNGSKETELALQIMREEKLLDI